jgi:hypothetical protein
MAEAVKNNENEGGSPLLGYESPTLLPRFIRVKFAPRYLGMDKNRFNDEVRPYLTEIPIGVQGIAFDRLELDAWAAQYKARYGRPATGGKLWDADTCRASETGAESGTLKSKSRDTDSFAKAVKRATMPKLKPTQRIA